MNKIITVTIIVLVALGFGFFLFKISPEKKASSSAVDGLFNLTPTVEKPLESPAAVQADDHILGKPEAKNILVEYGDIQCPACGAFEPTLKQLPSQLQDTKVVFRHYPLIGVHSNATISALAAEAAGAQGKFFEFIFALYENQQAWANLQDPSDKFVEIAQQVGVANIDQFKSDLNTHKYVERVQRDLTEAMNLALGGTPTLYFNGTRIEVAGLEAIKKEVEPLYLK